MGPGRKNLGNLGTRKKNSISRFAWRRRGGEKKHLPIVTSKTITSFYHLSTHYFIALTGSDPYRKKIRSSFLGISETIPFPLSAVPV